MVFSYDIKIPKERIAVLIGKKGEFKHFLEQETNTKIIIDSKDGDVTVSGDNAVILFSTKELIRAVGRGFNPRRAMQLLKQDYIFELINITDFARSKNDLMRLKGRVIGNKGKSRRVIEQITECDISVYGKTVGIIGNIEMVPIAKKAVESLLTGSPHSSVYSWLERKRKELKRNEILGKNNIKNIIKDEYLDEVKDLDNNTRDLL